MVRNDPWVLGISNSHNGAVCLLKGDEIVAAIQEERLARVKRRRTYGSLPSLAINYCLQHAGIKPGDLSLIAYCTQGRAGSALEDVMLNPLLHAARHRVPVVRLSHHAAHAISGFAASGFESTAVLVIDGVGSPEVDFSPEEKAAVKNPLPDGWETISLYGAEGTSLVPLEKHLVEKAGWITWELVRMPKFRSLGGLFSAAAWQIFGDHLEAGKVMGLAPYGQPEFSVSDFFEITADGNFDFHDTVPARFNHMDRWPKRQEEYQNLSASVQVALEEALLYLTRHLQELYPSSNLCYAGGVALNSVANERILRESGFRDVYFVPAAEDSGCAIGAAYHGLWQLTGRNTRRRLKHDAVGRSYSGDDISQALTRTPGIVVSEPEDVISAAVDLLCEGKIIGWFQGRSELGPRALGQRSILCDPRGEDAKAVLNSRVKHREGFRPFAPVIPVEDVADWFEIDGHDPASPFMLRICRFRESRMADVPAVVHVDGTGRFQTVTPEENGRFYELIRRFHQRTGVPIVLNTSFNVMDEPIVETPEDALWCFLSTGIDACVLEDRIATKKPGLKSVLDFHPYTTCSRLAVSRLVHPDNPAADGDSYVSFTVTTPWGVHRQIANPNVLPVLALMDGKTSGWEILEQLADQPAPLADEKSLIQSIGRWTNASQGEILVDGTAPVREIVNTLNRQRVTAYDEAALTRMLVRLRRHAVIAFRETAPES